MGVTLPLPDDSAYALLAVHTIYFWPEPAATLAEVARVLRHGGRLVLALRTAEHPLPRRLDRNVYHVPTTEQLIEWLDRAAFTDVQLHRRPDVAPAVLWITAAK